MTTRSRHRSDVALPGALPLGRRVAAGIRLGQLMAGSLLLALAGATTFPREAQAQRRYTDASGHLRVALSRQPFLPNGTSPGPATMASGGIQDTLARLGAVVRVAEAALTPDENTEYGGWKRLGMALGHFAGIVAQNEHDGFFTVGPAGDLPVDAGVGGRSAALGPNARGDPDRHALAGRASGFQHAGDDAQRFVRRYAGRGRHRPGAAADAHGRRPRSAAGGPPYRDGRRTPHRSAGAGVARRLVHRATVGRRSAHRLARGLRPARSVESPHRQDLRPHRHGRARSARGLGSPQQGPGRSIERAAGAALRADLQPLSEGRRRSDSPRFRAPIRAACRSPP